MADSIRITDEDAIKAVEKYAAEKEIPSTEAAARLINTATGRLRAIRKYAAANKPEPKPKKVKAVKVPKAPKAKVAKPAAAKRPSLARAKPAKPVQTEIPGAEVVPA